MLVNQELCKEWTNSYGRVIDLDFYDIPDFGEVKIYRHTNEILECCVVLRNTSLNQFVQIEIHKGEFHITSTGTDGYVYTLCSGDLHHKLQNTKSLDISEVLIYLQKDNNFSVPAIAVKKELVRLMIKNLCFTNQDRRELDKLYKIWRKPIISSN